MQGFKIPLMRKAFLKEKETKIALAEFIMHAERLSMDSKCFEFQQRFSLFQSRQHSILYNSGASANLAMLQALLNLGRIKSGDQIAFSDLTWSTNTMPIIQLGLNPVAVDCELDTLNVSLDKFKLVCERNDIKVFFITNVLGWVDNIDAIAAFCKERGIILIEDNCESLGTVYKNTLTGNFGLASSFSFFVAHHMSTIEGGMVCTDDDEFAEMLTIVRANGWDRNLSSDLQQKWRSKNGSITEFQAKYTFYDLAYNLRPTEITGFLGLFQMQFLEENITKRQDNYLAVEKVILSNADILPLRRDHIQTLSTFAFPIVCKSAEVRDYYINKFTSNSIEIRPMIAGSMQKQPFYKKYCDHLTDTPNTNHLHECGFYFGNYPELEEEDLNLIAEVIKA